MRRLTFGSLFLVALALAGCDALNKLKGGGDAGVEAAAPAITAAVDAAAAPATATAPTAPATLTPPTPVPGPHPVVVGDAGHPAADAGPPAVDGGHAPPSPTPMPTIPPIPPLPFDAGALRLPDGGFKPPWVH